MRSLPGIAISSRSCTKGCCYKDQKGPSSLSNCSRDHKTVQKLQQLGSSLSLCTLLHLSPVDYAWAQEETPDPGQLSRAVSGVAGLFSSSLEEEVDRFTLYGKTLKKYLIEKTENGKIIGRRKGFTVRSCVGAIPEVLETPQFRGLAPSEKVDAIDSRSCVEATGQDLLDVCKTACSMACESALENYVKELKLESGLDVGEKNKDRIMTLCQRQCKYECSKTGKISDFDVPSQR